MPLRLDIKKKLNARSERVKCVDIHPTEPWVLSSLYDGNVYIYDYATQAIVKSFEVSEQPVRCGRFIPRKQWIVVGCDDMFVRVYNYNTMEKVRMFEAHMDYIRSIAVHPTLPYVVTASDDMLIKLWDWDKDWLNTMIFEGHSHYVMQVTWNPKDANTFASASLDHTVKVWNLSSPVPNFTLEGHEKGVNCVDYYHGGDKPYLVTGSDDQTVKVWDYQTKSCVQTLDGHTHNVSCVAFLADRPLIVSGSEDGNVLLHHSNTYRLESTLNYGLDRCWSVSTIKGVNKIAFGYDEGTIVIRLGKDHPIASMDNTGKVIIAKHNEISTVNVRNLDTSAALDGERVSLPSKDLGSCEIYPQTLRHSPNGRFVAVCGDGEFIIYTAIAWRNKSYGSADEVVWDSVQGEYATRQGSSDVRIFNKSFTERQAMRPSFAVEGLYGGALLGLRSDEFVCFYEWETLSLIRRIDVSAREVYWSDAGNLVVLAAESSFFMLKYSREAVDEVFERSGGKLGGDGVEEAFDLIQEVPEKVVTGCWVGDCFLYTNASNRLNYCVGSEIATMFHLDRQLYILGYLPKENRLYCVDKDSVLVTFQVLLAVLEYKTAVVRGDLATAGTVLPRIPTAEHNKLARFLESQGLREEAMALATDPDFKCELAIALGRLETAAEFARQSPSELKWSQLAGLATTKGDFALAEECMRESRDHAGLLTLSAARGDARAIEAIAQESGDAGRMNISFLCNFMLNRLDQCIDLLVSVGRFAEAAVFARTYKPSRITEVVELWKADLRKAGDVRIADSIADPTNHPHLFPEHEAALAAEAQALKTNSQRQALPASSYPVYQTQIGVDQVTETMENTALGNGVMPTKGSGAAPNGETPGMDHGDAVVV